MKDDIYATVRRHSRLVLNGTLLAIDPASGGTSLPGWAAYKCGQFLKSGVLQISNSPRVQERLRALYELLCKTQPDVVAIERIRGSRAHAHLQWSVGVAVAATCPHTLIEVPVSSWKKHAGTTHVKGDESDAVAIGNFVVDLAQGQRK